MATPMRSSDFRSIVEPVLNEAFDGIYEQRVDEWKPLFKVRPGIARNYHEEPVLYGFPAAPEMPDGSPVTYSSGGQLYVARYIYKIYGLAFALTKVLVEDGDHIRLGPIYAEHLAQSIIETRELNAANIFNRAFNASYPGGDGQPLVSTAHPIVTGTLSNQLTTAAALSQTSLEQALIQTRRTQDWTGRRIHINPDKLVVSPENEYQGEVILKSVLRTGTANNDINPIKSRGMLGGGLVVVTRLTSTTAWWIKAGNVPRGLQMLTRRTMQKSTEGDFESDAMRYKCTERYIFGFTDWHDIPVGTAGL